MMWRKHSGQKGLQAPLSSSGDYVISHRPGQHTVSHRPPGQHHHVGTFSSSSLAKKAAEKHFRSLTSEFIAEEVRTGKYPRKQAVAIGLSRARAATKRESVRRSLENMLKKYR